MMYLKDPDRDKEERIAKSTLSMDEQRSKAYGVVFFPPPFR